MINISKYEKSLLVIQIQYLVQVYINISITCLNAAASY